MGGKEVLIKSVVQAIPVYSMGCFKLPRGLCEQLNLMIRKFWWGCKEGQRKIAWVSWEMMTRPKAMEGLGFWDLELFKLALLARQAWRILQDPSSLSARILKAVYFPDSSLLEASVGSHPSQVWRSIVKGRDILAQGLIKRIGDGATIEVWRQNWLPREGSMWPFTHGVFRSTLCQRATSWNIVKCQILLHARCVEAKTRGGTLYLSAPCPGACGHCPRRNWWSI